MWGGLHNPIVIIAQGERKIWGRQEQFQEPPEASILSLLAEFDVDHVVTLGSNDLPSFLQASFKDRHITHEGLWEQSWQRPVGNGASTISRFLEIWAFAESIWKAEVLGQDNNIRVMSTVDDPSSELFVAAQFGRYGPDIPQQFLEQRLGARGEAYDAAWRQQFELGRHLFPVDLTQHALTMLGPVSHYDHGLFALDTANTFDVVDFWNLRAAGMTVFPLPVGSYQEFSAGVKAFIGHSQRASPSNFPDGQLIKSKSVSDKTIEEIGRWLTAQTGARLALHGWVPRIGHDGNLRAIKLEADSATGVVVIDGAAGHLIGLVPSCDFIGPARQQQWSSDLSFYNEVDESHMHQLPWLSPECDWVAGRHIGFGIGERAGRVSRDGLVCHHYGDDRDTTVRLIPVRDVVEAVLRQHQMQLIGPSPNGLAMERIVAQLGGLRECAIFQHRGVRDVMSRLERGEQSLPARDIMATLHKMNRKATHRMPDMSKLMDVLVEKHVLRPGLVFQCRSCGRHAWYHVSSFDERFECKWCFLSQPCPRVETLNWHYRTDGLFALEGRMGGNLSVLLAILHLRQHHFHEAFYYYPSFEYRAGVSSHEVDFICFIRDRALTGRDEIQTVIGEAKTTTDLAANEVDRMLHLGQKLDAWVAFCTLSTFSDSDKGHFRRLRDAGLRLILLEGSELEMFHADMNARRSQVGYTQYDTELTTLSRRTTDALIGPPEYRANRI